MSNRPRPRTRPAPIASARRSRGVGRVSAAAAWSSGSDSFGLKQVGGHIALSGQPEHRRDAFPLSQTLRDVQGRATIRSRGDPAQDSFFAREAPRKSRRVLVAHLDYLVVRMGVEVFRHEAGPDPLDLVKAG